MKSDLSIQDRTAMMIVNNTDESVNIAYNDKGQPVGLAEHYPDLHHIQLPSHRFAVPEVGKSEPYISKTTAAYEELMDSQPPYTVTVLRANPPSAMQIFEERLEVIKQREAAKKECERILSKDGAVKYRDMNPMSQATWNSFERGFMECFNWTLKQKQN